MEFVGAVIKEQGVTFAVVRIKWEAYSNSSTRKELHANTSTLFPGIPLVLTSQDSSGRHNYFGDKNIVSFLTKIDPSRIPWKKYSFR